MDYKNPFAGRMPDDYFWGMPNRDMMQPSEEEVPTPHMRDIGAPRIIEMPPPRIRNMSEPMERQMPDMQRMMPSPGMWEMPPMPDRAMPDPQIAEILELIRKTVAGEAEDTAFYNYLISKAPTAEEKTIISGIRDDEMKHYSLFRQLYRELSGGTLPAEPAAPFKQPASYCAGLKKALLGEQKAVQTYRKILFALTDRQQINLMTEIITDELRHLGLYNYLYARNRCNL